MPVCTTKEYHCFWEPVSLEYNVSGKKFLHCILNAIVYSGSLQKMVEYFRYKAEVPGRGGGQRGRPPLQCSPGPCF